MVLQEWAEIVKLYNACQTRRLKAIFVPRYRELWAAAILAPLSLLGWCFTRGVARQISLCLMVLFICLLYVELKRALAKEFKEEYAKHGIADWPIGTRQRYLRYALFLRELVDQGHSSTDVTRLKCIAEVVGNPQPAFGLYLHPLFSPLVAGFTVVLLTSWIKEWPLWKSGGEVLVIVSLFGGLFYAYDLLDLFLIQKRKRQEIQLFLQWAELDIEEEQSHKS